MRSQWTIEHCTDLIQDSLVQLHKNVPKFDERVNGMGVLFNEDEKFEIIKRMGEIRIMVESIWSLLVSKYEHLYRAPEARDKNEVYCLIDALNDIYELNRETGFVRVAKEDVASLERLLVLVSTVSMNMPSPQLRSPLMRRS